MKGFVSINPRWAGFTSDDYIRASRSVSYTDTGDLPDNVEITAQSGDFDLRGYEIARSQFFDIVRKACVTFSINELKFGIECIRKMDNIPSVELMLYPDEYLLAVRPAAKDNRNAVRWTAFKGTVYQPRIISGTAFLKTIYEIFGWRADCKYRVRGIRKQNTEESVYLFDMRETEVFIPSEQVTPDDDNLSDFPKNVAYSDVKPIITTPKTVCAYPADWVSSFGSDYYRHAQAQEMAAFSETGEWNISSEGQAFNEMALQVTGIEDIKAHIDQIIEDIKRKGEQPMEEDTCTGAVPSVRDNDTIQDESFSYAGYQVVRGEFFAHINEPSITFNKCKVSVNTACVNKLQEVDYVQILVNPSEMKLAVRPCKEDEQDSFLWCGIDRKTGRKKPRGITCRLFFAKVVQLMDWNPDYRYKMLGKLIQSNGENLFIFDLTATEIYQFIQQNGEKPRSSRTPVFPAEWQNQFGLPVEEHRRSLQVNIFDGYAVFGLKDPVQAEKVRVIQDSEGTANE